MKQTNRNTPESKNKHMDLELRQEIQLGLEQRWSLKKIALKIEKDPTTVSKEIRKHIQVKNNINLDDEAEVIHYNGQGDIIPTPKCPLLLKPPYVCNGCDIDDSVGTISYTSKLGQIDLNRSR